MIESKRIQMSYAPDTDSVDIYLWILGASRGVLLADCQMTVLVVPVHKSMTNEKQVPLFETEGVVMGSSLGMKYPL
jgi:hypothetical protein